MNIRSILDRAVSLYPRAVAVVDGPRRLTYAEMGADVGRLAAFLQACGVGPGDRVAVLARNGLEYLEAYFAVATAGAVSCPLNYRLAPEELVDIVDDCAPRVVLAEGRFGGAVREVRARCGSVREVVTWGGAGAPDGAVSWDEALAAGSGAPAAVDVAPDDLAHLYYTSGTTGRPKGVMLTHRNVCVHALGAIVELGLSERDVWGHIAPMFHLADAWATFAVTWVGGRHHMVAEFGAARVLRAVEAGGITVTNLIPTMLNLVLKDPALGRHDTHSLRLVLSGGAPMAPELVGRIRGALGCDYVQTYGMTETSPYLTLSTLKPHLRALPEGERLRYQARTGRPFVTVELRVVNEAGREVAANDREVGEIRVRGETVTPGYWNRPGETAAAFDEGGWLRTGDLAVVDAEGYVDIVDRKKDMIITGGENVYSIEVENVLYRHPAVLEAAVFGVPDDRWGESVRAAVVLRAGREAGAEELRAFCRTHLAAYKTPARVHFVEALPRTGSGKISKRALRAELGAGRGSGAA